MKRRKVYHKTCERKKCDKGKDGNQKKFNTHYGFKKHCSRDCTVRAHWERQILG